jgi:hypothetical protein
MPRASEPRLHHLQCWECLPPQVTADQFVREIVFSSFLTFGLPSRQKYRREMKRSIGVVEDNHVLLARIMFSENRSRIIRQSSRHGIELTSFGLQMIWPCDPWPSESWHQRFGCALGLPNTEIIGPACTNKQFLVLTAANHWTL